MVNFPLKTPCGGSICTSASNLVVLYLMALYEQERMRRKNRSKPQGPIAAVFDRYNEAATLKNKATVMINTYFVIPF